MKPQAIFDKVARHLFEQGHKSTRSFTDLWGSETTNCAYRGSDGSSCAVGCLISKSAYRKGMDERVMAADTLMDHYWDVLPKYFAKNIRLLLDLQRVHDHDANWASSDAMKISLEDAADKHGLSVDILDGDELSFADGR